MIDANDVARISPSIGVLLDKSGDTPIQMAGRLFGLGADQQRAGIPKWAWTGIGVVVGATLMWTYGDKLKAKLGG